MGLPKVYGSPMSTCTARVTAVLEELGVAYELIPINFATGEHKQPPHTSRNPFGQVPAFEDGDLTLFESRAITRYIARKYKGFDLLREGNSDEAALVDVWVEVEAQQYYPPASAIVYQTLVAPLFGGVPDEQIIAKNAEKLAKVLDVYEAKLSKTKYLAGDFFSLADIHHLPAIFYIVKSTCASLFDSRPKVKAWWEDISSRPACKKVLDVMAATVDAVKKGAA